MWPSPTPGRPADRLTALENSPSQIRPTGRICRQDLPGGDMPGPCAPVPPAPPVLAPGVRVPASLRQRGAIRSRLGITGHLGPVFAPLVGADRSYGRRAHDHNRPAPRGRCHAGVRWCPGGAGLVVCVLRRGVGAVPPPSTHHPGQAADLSGRCEQRGHGEPSFEGRTRPP